MMQKDLSGPDVILRVWENAPAGSAADRSMRATRTPVSGASGRPDTMVRTLQIRCGDCGAPLKEYELYDRETGDVVGTHEVCPNEWRENHP